MKNATSMHDSEKKSRPSDESDLDAKGASTIWIEAWVNNVLAKAEALSFPTVIKRPEHMKPL